MIHHDIQPVRKGLLEFCLPADWFPGSCYLNRFAAAQAECRGFELEKTKV
jgi:hypothetical protein